MWCINSGLDKASRKADLRLPVRCFYKNRRRKLSIVGGIIMGNTNIPVTKVHTYNVSVAADVGINAAVLFYNICYWVEENKTNERNFINGKYWTYNTIKALQTMFPEMTKNQIEYALKKLKDNGYIESATLSEDTRDRTNYYTVCDIEKWILCEKKSNGISENSDMATENSNMTSEKSDMFNILYNNKNINTDNKQSDNNNTNNSHKGKNINKVNEQVKTSFSEKKLTHTQKSAKQRYLDKKADEFEMLNNILLICNSDYDEQIGNEIFKSLEHYFERYTQKTGLIHPILKTETLEEIIDKMANYSDMKYFHFGNIAEQEGAFIKIIDAFFDGDFGSVTGQRTNWHLPHFMSDGVLDRLTQRIWGAGEVY